MKSVPDYTFSGKPRRRLQRQACEAMKNTEADQNTQLSADDRIKVVVVASKLPPEYSGPGTRMMRLYSAPVISARIASVCFLCNGIEWLDNEEYEESGFKVKRVTAKALRTARWLPKFVRDKLAYAVETIRTIAALNQFSDADLIHVLGYSGEPLARFGGAGTAISP